MTPGQLVGSAVFDRDRVMKLRLLTVQGSSLAAMHTLKCMKTGRSLSSAVLLGATTAALGTGFGLSAAQAAQTTVTKTIKTVDPGSTDTGTYGTAAWRSGSLTIVATRTGDGRIAVRMQATLVARRAFLAQLYISPCNAAINTAMLLDPARYPPVPAWNWIGPDVTETKQVHKGVNDLRFAGVVSSDDRWTPAPRHWTDCAVAGVADERETDAAALRLTPEIRAREGDSAFAKDPAILTLTTDDGQHL
ncbi:hypothetical protein [Baekduia sp.]|uniref:hypothetical protein n=1 Tax=Baekduia sp. TaxID=2600305 RepID=UPI002D1FBC49|nr:hypothetical protein [Baekduia sp.]